VRRRLGELIPSLFILSILDSNYFKLPNESDANESSILSALYKIQYLNSSNSESTYCSSKYNETDRIVSQVSIFVLLLKFLSACGLERRERK